MVVTVPAVSVAVIGSPTMIATSQMLSHTNGGNVTILILIAVLIRSHGS